VRLLKSTARPRTVQRYHLPSHLKISAPANGCNIGLDCDLTSRWLTCPRLHCEELRRDKQDGEHCQRRHRAGVLQYFCRSMRQQAGPSTRANHPHGTIVIAAAASASSPRLDGRGAAAAWCTARGKLIRVPHLEDTAVVLQPQRGLREEGHPLLPQDTKPCRFVASSPLEWLRIPSRLPDFRPFAHSIDSAHFTVTAGGTRTRTAGCRLPRRCACSAPHRSRRS
jgi:hypothetical protein